MPDEILVLMLSRLTLREAVRTSVLSKRWRYVWTSISVLNFDAAVGNIGKTDFVSWVYCVLEPRTKKNDFFSRFFGEKSVFGGAGKDFRVEKSSAKKSVKNRQKSPIFRQKTDIFPKKSDFFRNLYKLYFRSLRGEILKNGANQSCRIKKKCTFGKNNSCLVH